MSVFPVNFQLEVNSKEQIIFLLLNPLDYYCYPKLMNRICVGIYLCETHGTIERYVFRLGNLLNIVEKVTGIN